MTNRLRMSLQFACLPCLPHLPIRLWEVCWFWQGSYTLQSSRILDSACLQWLVAFFPHQKIKWRTAVNWLLMYQNKLQGTKQSATKACQDPEDCRSIFLQLWSADLDKACPQIYINILPSTLLLYIRAANLLQWELLSPSGRMGSLIWWHLRHSRCVVCHTKRFHSDQID